MRARPREPSLRPRQAWASTAPWWIVVAGALGAGCGGCQYKPLLEGDPVAQNEYYESITASDSEPRCEPTVPVHMPSTAPTRPYRELSRVSVSCYPGTLNLCWRRLAAEGCRRGGDAVMVLDAAPASNTGTRQAGSTGSYVTRSGAVILWLPSES